MADRAKIVLSGWRCDGRIVRNAGARTADQYSRLASPCNMRLPLRQVGIVVARGKPVRGPVACATGLRHGRGDFPKQHPVLGALQPSADAVASVLAGRNRTRLQPAGVYAANALALAEQVPAKVVFLADGPIRTVKFGPLTIQLRRTTARNMAAAARLSGLLIQALRELGKEHVTPERLAHLNRTHRGCEKIQRPAKPLNKIQVAQYRPRNLEH